MALPRRFHAVAPRAVALQHFLLFTDCDAAFAARPLALLAVVSRSRRAARTVLAAGDAGVRAVTHT